MLIVGWTIHSRGSFSPRGSCSIWLCVCVWSRFCAGLSWDRQMASSMDLVTSRFNGFPLRPPQVHINIPTSLQLRFCMLYQEEGGRCGHSCLEGFSVQPHKLNSPKKLWDIKWFSPRWYRCRILFYVKKCRTKFNTWYRLNAEQTHPISHISSLLSYSLGVVFTHCSLGRRCKWWGKELTVHQLWRCFYLLFLLFYLCETHAPALESCIMLFWPE